MNFERLLVWQEAVELFTKVILSFKHCRDFGFKDQVTRSSLSVPSNIAEGMSRRGDKEKIQFLCISLGSCAELKTQLIIAEQVGYLPTHNKKEFLLQCHKIAKMINTLKSKIETTTNNH